ncbi:MAG: transcriptional regulator [bacterium]|nr:transcriptional regulator [bacterium]
MPLTRDFQETVQARALTDRAFREKLLQEGVECLLAGDIEAGKITLRDYINATIGFKKLGLMTDKPPKSLMRMFGPAGNPHARNIFAIIAHIQHHEGIHLEVSAVRQSHGTQQARARGSAT